eukprot:2737361-Pyramimonas_sp.AAC.1
MVRAQDLTECRPYGEGPPPLQAETFHLAQGFITRCGTLRKSSWDLWFFRSFTPLYVTGPGGHLCGLFSVGDGLSSIDANRRIGPLRSVGSVVFQFGELVRAPESGSKARRRQPWSRVSSSPATCDIQFVSNISGTYPPLASLGPIPVVPFADQLWRPWHIGAY